MSFAICFPAGMYQDLPFCRVNRPKDRKAEEVGKDGESGELTLGSSYCHALIDTNSSVGSPGGQ